MANKKFTDFTLINSSNDGDYFVGYNAAATNEVRITYKNLYDGLPSEFKYQGTDLKDLSANWEETYTTVLENSATNWDNSSTLSYVNATFLPLTGGALTGAISLNNVEVQPGETLTDSLSSLIITINGQQFKIPLLSI
jgi:hypothetical protein